MGKGIALEFKNRFQEMFKDYVKRCERNEIRIGQPYVYKNLFGPQIVNFPTKEHWKSVSKVSDIESGLDYLLAHYREWGITSIAIPPLGCGNGQLEWEVVGPFSKEVKLAVTKLINNNLLQEERLGSMFKVKVGPTFKDARRRYKFLLEKYVSLIEKTTDIFVRVETKQAEIIATVIFTADKLRKNKRSTVSEMDVLEAVLQWKHLRRPKLDKAEVASTIRNLGMLRWLDVKPDDRLPFSENGTDINPHSVDSE